MDLNGRPLAPSCGCLARTRTEPTEWGLAPSATETPRSAAEAARALRAFGEGATPVWIVGAASRLGACPPVPSRAAVLSTAGLDGIVAYEPEDLTLTVRGGTPLETVHSALAEHGHELPGAHFGLAGGTVGGALATGLTDVRRARGTALRDRILGMEIATTDGVLSRSGGRVVKNVAGYDIGRLIAGSHGALALITEVTMRLSPQPEAHRPFERGHAKASDAIAAGLSIARELPALGFVAVIASAAGARVLWVHEGDREEVEAGVRASEVRFGAARAEDAHDHDAPIAARLDLNALEHVCPERTNVLLRAGVRPSRLPALFDAWAAIAPRVHGAHGVTGQAFARFDLSAGAGALARATAAVESLGGWWRVQGSWRPSDGPGVVPWGGIETPWALYARLAAAFDAKRVLGPDVYRSRALAGVAS